VVYLHDGLVGKALGVKDVKDVLPLSGRKLAPGDGATGDFDDKWRRCRVNECVIRRDERRFRHRRQMDVC
jgi:hypothetical protein